MLSKCMSSTSRRGVMLPILMYSNLKGFLPKWSLNADESWNFIMVFLGKMPFAKLASERSEIPDELHLYSSWFLESHTCVTFWYDWRYSALPHHENGFVNFYHYRKYRISSAIPENEYGELFMINWVSAMPDDDQIYCKYQAINNYNIGNVR